jgi:hypothetical protein
MRGTNSTYAAHGSHNCNHGFQPSHVVSHLSAETLPGRQSGKAGAAKRSVGSHSYSPISGPRMQRVHIDYGSPMMTEISREISWLGQYQEIV